MEEKKEGNGDRAELEKRRNKEWELLEKKRKVSKVRSEEKGGLLRKKKKGLERD